jgi:Ca2+-binding EF-hand superfamily protein
MASFIPNPGQQQSLLKQECSICCDRLCLRPISLLVDSENGPVCSHCFHTECIEEFMEYNSLREHLCPLCRRSFSHSIPVPPVEVDPRAWFDFMDRNQDGSLSYSEILEGLKSQLPLDWREIEDSVVDFWFQWDKDRNGVISYEEFSDPETGVLAYLKQVYPRNPSPEPPDLINNYSEWFNYWDEDGSGTLDKSEVVRALIKTFRMYNIDKSAVSSMVDNIWPIIDYDNSGVIELDEFKSRDNLGDILSAEILRLRRE